MLQSRREYAASLGLAKAGARGKLSSAAHAAIAKAEADGMTFADTAYSVIVREKNDPAAVKAKHAKKQAAKTIKVERADDFRPSSARFPGGTMWKGQDASGKECFANEKQICLTCGCSLSSHLCETPSTLTALYPNGRVVLETVKLVLHKMGTVEYV